MNFAKEYEHLVAQLQALPNSNDFDSSCVAFERSLLEYDRAAWLELNKKTAGTTPTSPPSSSKPTSKSNFNTNTDESAASHHYAQFPSSPAALLAVSGVACGTKTPAAKALQTVHPLLSNFSRSVNARRFPVHNESEKWVPPDEFERRSSKYWVLPEHVLPVKLLVLRHMPLLEVNETPPVAAKWADQNDTQISQYINSVYFDSSAQMSDGKMSLECYHRRIAQEEGAVLVRCRFYAGIAPSEFEKRLKKEQQQVGGSNKKKGGGRIAGGAAGAGGDDASDSCSDDENNDGGWSSPLPIPDKGSENICYVEVKTHHEFDPSTKERLPMYLRMVDPFFAGTLSTEDIVNTMIKDKVVKPSRKPTLLRLGALIQRHAKHLNNSSSTNGGGGGGACRPIVRTVYHRSAFQQADSNDVRISFDFPMVLVTERGHTFREAVMARDFGREETTPFPFGVFELKLGGEGEPDWVQHLLATGWIRRCDKFSKYQCAVATFFRESVRMLPFWLPEVTKRPPAYQSLSRILATLHSSSDHHQHQQHQPLLLLRENNNNASTATKKPSSSAASSRPQLARAAANGGDDDDGLSSMVGMDDEKAPLLGDGGGGGGRNSRGVAPAAAVASSFETAGGGGGGYYGSVDGCDDGRPPQRRGTSPKKKSSPYSVQSIGGDAGGISSSGGGGGNKNNNCCCTTSPLLLDMFASCCSCCGRGNNNNTDDNNNKDDGAIPTNLVRQKPNDPKVFMAAERSLLKLQFGSCLLLGVGLSLLTFSDSGALFGTAVLVLAAVLTLWAYVVYQWRLNFIVTKKYAADQRFDDRIGPIAFTVGVVAIVILALVMAYTGQKNSPFTCVKQQPNCDVEPLKSDLRNLKRFTLDGGPLPWVKSGQLNLHDVEQRVTVCSNFQNSGAFSEPLSANGQGSKKQAKPSIVAYYELDEMKFCFDGYDCEKEVFGLWRDHAALPVDSESEKINENHTTAKLELFVRNDTALAQQLPETEKQFDTLLAQQCSWGVFSKISVFWEATHGGSVSTARPDCSVAPFNEMLAKKERDDNNGTTTTPSLFPSDTKVTCATFLKSNFQYKDVPFAGVTNGTLRVIPTFSTARDRALQMNPTSVSVTAVVKLTRLGFISYSTLMQAWSTLMAVYTQPETTFVSFKK